jgi:hypothetical protein
MTGLDALNADFRDMVVALCRAEAEFLIVGAYAVSYHGHPRTTGDFDLLVRPTPENARRVWTALLDFGAPVSSIGLRVDDLVDPNTVYQIGQPPRRIDLMTSISGVDFDVAWRTRVDVDWRGHRIGFLGFDALLTNKRAAGRAKDLEDVRALERLRRGEPRKRP